MNKKIVHTRTRDWKIISVYATRNQKGLPVNILLTLGQKENKYTKKIFLPLEEVQHLVGFMIDIDSPEKGLIGLKMRITETIKSLD